MQDRRTSHPRRKAGIHSPDEARGGFALVELTLALVILLLAAGIGITTLVRLHHRKDCDRLCQDLRTFAATFQQYERKASAWPAPTNGERAYPQGMEAMLKDTGWLEPSPLGGRYQWQCPYPPETAGSEAAKTGAIAITAFRPDEPLNLSRTDMEYIDTKIDDGNPRTGNFRAGFNGWPVLIVSTRR